MYRHPSSPWKVLGAVLAMIGYIYQSPPEGIVRKLEESPNNVNNTQVLSGRRSLRSAFLLIQLQHGSGTRTPVDKPGIWQNDVKSLIFIQVPRQSRQARSIVPSKQKTAVTLTYLTLTIGFIWSFSWS
jgi:hypothetical protein